MRKILLIVVVFGLVSCQQKKLDRMQAMQDSIVQAAIEKDSAILDFVSVMTEIQENLDSIKQVEEIVRLETSSGQEMKKSQRDQIVSDIRTIQELLQKNKELVVKLQKQLSSSGSKVAELQRAVLVLNRQVEQKDAEIATLNAELQKLQIDISGLNTRLESMASESLRKDEVIQQNVRTIEEQTVAMNLGYYAFGTVNELFDNGVIDKEGGFLGIGRTLVMRKDFNQEYFTMVDIRELTSLDLHVKKAQLVTSHPEGSYHFEGEKPVESLVIDNPQEFWKSSKYLIIAVTN
ncbi:hypothetical protein [Gaoshiqia sediminis]|uniref:Lipoprotein n=1 Tax=Gaoshiqia sediminis TaxID=2986998 RepID=A0AA42CBE2_9BACT|nr:hypothetical protein [Gaoshiqia sediminis]MCW0484895.1 hypothetical protein [Gaoshiqia sediminis]